MEPKRWGDEEADADVYTKAILPKHELLELVDDYWCIAYQQGKELAETDNEAGDAGRVHFALTSQLDLLYKRADAFISELDRPIVSLGTIS